MVIKCYPLIKWVGPLYFVKRSIMKLIPCYQSAPYCSYPSNSVGSSYQSSLFHRDLLYTNRSLRQMKAKYGIDFSQQLYSKFHPKMSSGTTNTLSFRKLSYLATSEPRQPFMNLILDNKNLTKNVRSSSNHGRQTNEPIGNKSPSGMHQQLSSQDNVSTPTVSITMSSRPYLCSPTYCQSLSSSRPPHLPHHRNSLRGLWKNFISGGNK